jgi:hypothetical protein
MLYYNILNLTLMRFFKILIFFCLIQFSCDKSECIENQCNGPVTMDYNPVCGCNNITYPNTSSAECHGILDYKPGECN